MKRFICLLVLFGVTFFVFSQEIIQTKLSSMGIKNTKITDNPSPKILKMYAFNENTANGGIIVFKVTNIKTDIFATIVKSGTSFMVVSVEAVNSQVYNKKTMDQLNEAFAKWNNITEKNIPDAVSSATKHSKGIYVEIQGAVADGIKILRKEKM